VIGGSAGWFVRGLTAQDVRAIERFSFHDKLATLSFLSARGTWRGGDLANKVNTVQITCFTAQNNCDLYQADVMSLGDGPLLSTHINSFRITKVDAHSVVAEPNLPDLCIRQTLTFDRVAKAVTLVRTKISREGACSIVQDAPLTLYLGEPLR